MNRNFASALIVLAGLSAGAAGQAADFGPAESVLGDVRSVRYENVYTKVPTSGKLVSIRITDSGTVYYICREKTGYAIYHLEIRPIVGYKEKIEQELREKKGNWEKSHPDELLFTRETLDREIKKNMRKYCDAVWVRNEIVVQEPPKERFRRDQ